VGLLLVPGREHPRCDRECFRSEAELVIFESQVCFIIRGYDQRVILSQIEKQIPMSVIPRCLCVALLRFLFLLLYPGSFFVDKSPDMLIRHSARGAHNYFTVALDDYRECFPVAMDDFINQHGLCFLESENLFPELR
jgi:hypothetical protein